MSAKRIVMACPVGTSLGGNVKPTHNDDRAWAKVLREERDRGEFFLKKFIDEKSEKSSVEEAVDAWLDEKTTIKNNTLPTAELQSIVRWIFSPVFQKEYKDVTIELHLLPSKHPDSHVTARMTSCFLSKTQYLKNLLPENVKIDFKDIKALPIDVSGEKEFNKSIGALFQKYDALRKEAGIAEFVINSTGGFKAICAFSSIYAQVHGLRCIYTFETNVNTAIELPSLPIGYALESLDDEISILKGLGQNQLAGIDRDSLSPWLQNLFRDEKLSPLADMLLKHYEERRHTSDAIGLGMLDQIEDAEIRNCLKELIRGSWSQLWLGDQIPETVEHSRRHSKRLMELAGNFCRCAKKELGDMGMSKDKTKALLIASIYLHDIGHTAMIHPLAPKSDAEGVFPLGDFPSCVREVHHLLSADAILARAEDLFPESNSGEDSEKIQGIKDMLRTLVPYVAAHHRGYTTLTNEQGKSGGKPIVNLVGKLLYGQKFHDTLQPLERRLEDDPDVILDKWGLTSKDVLTTAALLRVLDGCDAQIDRTGSDEYADARAKRTRMEAKAIWRELLPFLDGIDTDIRKSAKDIYKEAEKFELGEPDKKILGGLCGKIYEKVIEKLLLLKGSEEICAIMPGNHQEMMTLSMINRYAFKWEQFLHFDKHRSVNFVLPVRVKNDVIFRVFPNADFENKDRDSIVDEIVGAIRDEITKTGEVLKRLHVTVEKVNYDERK
ncbi:hypothetical protein FACS1894167_04870 [Synergistales bacterium]|nr:hypothetical protein FACS1894167_04870 [Synergistales bacterium]